MVGQIIFKEIRRLFKFNQFKDDEKEKSFYDLGNLFDDTKRKLIQRLKDILGLTVGLKVNI